MVELTEKQVQALKITQDVLVRIRRLAREPITPKTMAAIHDLADALHNVPGVVTRRPENQNLARMFDEELDRDLATAAGVYQREGFPAFAFAPDIAPLDVDLSAYATSGARFHVPAEFKQPSTTRADNPPCHRERRGSPLALFFRRILAGREPATSAPAVDESAANDSQKVGSTSKYPDIVLDIFKAIRSQEDYEHIQTSCNEAESGIAVPMTIFGRLDLPAAMVLRILDENKLLVEISQSRGLVILTKEVRALLLE